MFEKFTDRAKQAVSLAQTEAIDLGHDFIGTEHLLLGLARTSDGIARDVLGEHGVTPARARDETVRQLTEAGVRADGGTPAIEALASLGIDVAEIKRRADESFGPGRFRFPRPPFTPRLKRTMGLTLREAISLGHERIGPEHLVLGLLDDAESVAVKVLIGLRVDTAELRTAVLAGLTRQTS
jgi:ATP-dependent Clp protease ATP-binding subunit ClpA